MTTSIAFTAGKMRQREITQHKQFMAVSRSALILRSLPLPGLPKAICVFYRKALGLELVLENFKLTVKYGNNPQGT